MFLKISSQMNSSLTLVLLAVLLTTGASRWGSYIGVAPIYLTDIFLFLSLVTWLFLKKPNRALDFGAPRDPLLIAFGFYFVILMARFVFSIQEGYPTLDILRDFVPFFYLVITFITYDLFKNLSAEGANRIFRWIKAALLFHLIWCLGVVVSSNTQGFVFVPQVFGAGLFSFRPDFDTALVAVLLVLVLRELYLGKSTIVNWLTLLSCLLVIQNSPARSALIALFLGLIWLTFSLSGKSLSQGLSGNKVKQVLLKFTIFFSPIIFLTGVAGERLLASIGLSSGTDASLSNGIGTQQARQAAWTQIIEWVFNDEGRLLLGAGFGLNFLEVTNTISLLEGTTYTGVRSPHNFLLTSLARVGLPATLLLGIAVLAILFATFRSRGADQLNFLAMTLVLVFIPVALLGVVLEAPFGAVPFYFSLGVLLSNRVKFKKLS